MTRLTYKQKSGLYWFIFVLLAFIAIALSSCGVNYHLRKAERHLKKAEMKGAAIHADTVYKTITVQVPEVRTDTVFTSLPGDTITIQKDRLKVKYVRLPKDSVYIYGECADTVIYKDVIHTVTKEIKTPRGFWYYFQFIAIALVVGFICGVVFSSAFRLWLKSLL